MHSFVTSKNVKWPHFLANPVMYTVKVTVKVDHTHILYEHWVRSWYSCSKLLMLCCQIHFFQLSVCLFVVKHLWDEKPTDWPTHIPFKDPNNAVKDGKYSTLLTIN